MGGVAAVRGLGRLLRKAGATVLPGIVIPKMLHDPSKTHGKALDRIAGMLAG
jgi:hypothetical protein